MPFRRIDDPGRLQRLIQAVMVVEADLSLDAILRHLVEEARALTGARYGALGVLDADGRGLATFLASGLSGEEERAIGDPPTGKGVLGLVIADPVPLRIDDLPGHPDRAGFPPHHPPMTRFLGVPITVRGEVYGNLYLTDRADGLPFDSVDEALASTLGVAAGIAIENARMHERLAELTLLEDRDRIARDLHDTVIQRLFAAGLAVQGVAAAVERADLARRLDRVVDDLDATIRTVRATIFDLEEAPDHRGLGAAVATVVAEVVPLLGFEPDLDLEVADGPGTAGFVPDVLAVVREALTNVAKHARATSAAVTARAGRSFELTVCDDGVGMVPGATGGGGMGLANLRRRAERHGGSLTVGPAAGGGTCLVWAVPMAATGRAGG